MKRCEKEAKGGKVYYGKMKFTMVKWEKEAKGGQSLKEQNGVYYGKKPAAKMEFTMGKIRI